MYASVSSGRHGVEWTGASRRRAQHVSNYQSDLIIAKVCSRLNASSQVACPSEQVLTVGHGDTLARTWIETTCFGEDRPERVTARLQLVVVVVVVVVVIFFNKTLTIAKQLPNYCYRNIELHR